MDIDGQDPQFTTPVTERPLSPHLQVWRWHVTMLTSILHRATGIVLYGGALALAGWVVALASGPDTFSAYRALFGSSLGQAALFAVTLAIFYHLANGIRHLVWDSGHGFGVKTANVTALGVIVAAVAASLALWGFAAVTGTF
ncbi:MAG: succinate dehydrogenase, cytochrome b556 subunit [Caulobacteraceae bacterium]